MPVEALAPDLRTDRAGESGAVMIHRSRMLRLRRVAGWLTGPLPALVGQRAVYATINVVETFVDQPYAE